jgi:lipopolysaccharide transport system permease protein
MTSQPNPSEIERVVEASRGRRNIDFKEIWQFRELLFFFTWRDIVVRYKQTVMGVLWAILQPVITMIVFSVFFGKFAKVPSQNIPYPIFVYAGLLPWFLFSQSLTRSAESIVGNANLIRKVYFPRIIIPASASLSALVDFAISFVILIAMMFWYHIVPGFATILLLPILILLVFLCSVGMGFWLSAINVSFRDVRYAIPFFIQLGMFITPVIYPVTVVPAQWSWILYLNPMTGLIETIRAVLLNSGSIPIGGLFISIAITVVSFIFGTIAFSRMERQFADMV